MTSRERFRLNGRGALSGPAMSPKQMIALGGILLVIGLTLVAVRVGLPIVDEAPFAAHSVFPVVAAGLSFAFAGVFLLIGGASGAHRHRRRAQISEMYPLEPWLWDHPWTRHLARDGARSELGRALVRSAFLTLFLSMFNWVVWHLAADSLVVTSDPPWIALARPGQWPPVSLWAFGAIVALFDLIALFCWWDALYRAARLRKFGEGELRFERFPFFLGDEMHAVLRLPEVRGGYSSMTWTLRYVEEVFETVRRHDGKHETSVAVFECYRERGMSKDPGFLGRLPVGVPIAFLLPGDMPECDLSSPQRSYWELEVEASVSGVDYGGRFLLPVYLRPGEVSEVPASQLEESSVRHEPSDRRQPVGSAV